MNKIKFLYCNFEFFAFDALYRIFEDFVNFLFFTNFFFLQTKRTRGNWSFGQKLVMTTPKKKTMSPLDQKLTSHFQQLNMTPDYTHQGTHNFSKIISLIDQICQPNFFNSNKFTSVFKICLNRLLNITGHEKCQNFTRMEVLRLLGEIGKRCLYSNNFHIFMFELYKVVKDGAEK